MQPPLSLEKDPLAIADDSPVQDNRSAQGASPSLPDAGAGIALELDEVFPSYSEPSPELSIAQDAAPGAYAPSGFGPGLGGVVAASAANAARTEGSEAAPAAGSPLGTATGVPGWSVAAPSGFGWRNADGSISGVNSGNAGGSGSGRGSGGSGFPPSGGQGAGMGNSFGGGPDSRGPGNSGAWVWLPEGLQARKAWRKRHPVLFWGGMVVLILGIFAWGRFSAKEGGPLSGPKIAIVNVEGMILDATEVVDWMETVRRDPSFKGAVIRINSPGGAVGPSEEIYQAVKRLAKDKEVVVSMGALAASGGYYAALGADEIYANASTVTASIGVKMQVPNMEGLMKTIGISEKTLTTGKLKDAGSSWRDMAPEEEAYFRELIGDMYESFIETVAKERKLPLETVRTLADGRAMTGRQALQVKLVDKLGDMHDAAKRVLERCKIAESAPVNFIEGPEKPTTMLKDLMGAVMQLEAEQRASMSQPVFMY